MRSVALLLFVVVSVAAADPKYRGVEVDIDFKQAPLEDLLRFIADTGRVNIVLLDVPPVKLDIRAKQEPWDKVLDDLIARARLAYARTGNLYLVGQPAWITERKKQKPRVYTGPTIDLDVKDADAVAVGALIAAVSGKRFEAQPKAARRVRLRLKRIPADLAFEIVLAQTRSTAVAKPGALAKPGAKCIAPATSLVKLVLSAIASGGTKRWALFVDPAGVAHLVTHGTCIGSEKAKALELGENFVTFDMNGSEVDHQLYKLRP